MGERSYIERGWTIGLVNLLDRTDSTTAKLLTDVLGWSSADLEGLPLECKQEPRQKRVHSYYHEYVLMGQKKPCRSSAL